MMGSCQTNAKTVPDSTGTNNIKSNGYPNGKPKKSNGFTNKKSEFFEEDSDDTTSFASSIRSSLK